MFKRVEQKLTAFKRFGYKLSPGGLRQFTLSPIRDYDRTQELGLTLSSERYRVLSTMPAL